MDWEDPNFLRNLGEALRNLPEGNRRQPRRIERAAEVCKVSELPEFNGGIDPDKYLEWETKIERIFEFREMDDDQCCKYAILKLGGGASLWFEGLKAKRAREYKDKISSWVSLKRKLRKRYVPINHRLSTYKKIADLKQGKMSVGEYVDEFERLALLGDMEEIEEQRMSRFLRGLNFNISSVVEMYPYSDFDTLCSLCLKVEAQSKQRYGSSSAESSKVRSWGKTESLPKQPSSSSPIGAPSAPVAPKPTNAFKETSLSKVRCFKCQGFGHYQNACPNKRVVTLREAFDYREELLEEERLSNIFSEEKEEEEEEEEESYEAPRYDTALVLRTLKTEVVQSDSDQRDQIFHTKCLVKDKWCSLIIDGGSCTNVASSEMVSKLGLITANHPRPYVLHWLDDGNKVKVTKQVKVALTMGSYEDEVLCDVIPMDACHILLGRPWQFDRDVVHRGRANEHELRHNGKKFVLKPMSSSDVRSMSTKQVRKPTLTMLASEREVEQALDQGEMLYTLVAKGEERAELFEHNEGPLADLLVEYGDVFPTELPPGLPPFRGIEHQIDLIPGAPLPNKAAYRCNPEETKELQKQVGELMQWTMCEKV